MKIFAKTLFLMCAVVLTFSGEAVAQKKKKGFKGTLTYSISYEGAEIDPATKAQLPTQHTVKILGNKSRMDMEAGPVTQSKITNGDNKTTTVLLDLMGQKFAIKMTETEVMEAFEESGKPTTEIGTETKEIAGYTCTKAVITLPPGEDEEEGSKMTCWFTNDLGGQALNWDGEFMGIDGVVMEYEQYNPQLEATMIYTCTTVKKGKVKSIDFLIPEDFKVVTPEELKSILGGSME